MKNSNHKCKGGIWDRVRKVTHKMKARPAHSYFVKYDKIIQKLDSNEFRTPADWYRTVMNLYEAAKKSQTVQMNQDIIDQLIYQFQKSATGLNISTTSQWCAEAQDQFRQLDSLLINCPYPFLVDSQLISVIEDSANSFTPTAARLEKVIRDIKHLISIERAPDPERDINNFYLGAFRDKFIDMENFKFIKELGSGTYATVTLEKFIPTGQLVAIKTMNERDSFSQRAIECFCREVSILAMHQHHCILPFFGFTNIDRNGDNALIIATDFMDHGTLRDLLNLELSGQHPEEWTQTKKSIVALGVASGMKFLHQCKVVHRDLKSLNILLDENYEPKIADMGFAKFLHEGEIQTMRIGSYPWMAPEVISTHTYNEKADIYSFAMIMYEMLTLKYPFSGQTSASIQCQVLTNQRPQLNSNETNHGIVQLIQRCWAQSPDERPSFAEISSSLIAEECLFEDTNIEQFRAFVLKLQSEAKFVMNMIIAAKNNFIEITRSLVEDPKTNLNEVDDEGSTAVHIAVKNEFCKLLRLLIDIDEIDMNVLDSHHKSSIHYASELSNEACLRLLLTRYDCSVNLKDEKGNTALHIAVSRKADDIVMLLLTRRDCNVNSVNDNNDTPLTLAIRGNSRSIVQKLISTCKLKMDIPQHHGLLNDAICRNNTETVKLLLQIPNININYSAGDQTPLMNAIQSKNPLILMPLLSVPQLDLSPETITKLIGECIRVNDLLFLRVLLSMKDVDLNYSLQEVVAPLILAAHIGNIEAVSMLINSPRIDVNVQEYSSGFTAMHIAVQNDRIDIVKLLMANSRVNPNIENHWKQTPIKLAASNPAIRKLLKK